jgi:peptide/nickel transport system substrate-binding protein
LPRRVLVAGLLLLGVFAASCRRARVPGAAGTLRIAQETPVLSLDPTLSERRTFSALSNVFEPLVAFDRNLQLVPSLAVRWETPNDTTWRFFLRPDVLFHDGTKLDADAVAAALDRARNGEDSTVRGALWAVSRIGVESSLSLRIETSVPDALLLHELTLVLVARGATRADVEAHPVGTGPYRVASWDRDAELALVAWEKHWAGPPRIPAVRIAPLLSGEEGARAVARGEAGVAEVPPSAARASAPRGVRMVSSPGLSTQLLWMNGPAVVDGRPNPFFDVRVRRAVALAVDRPRLALTATGTAATAAPQLVPPRVVGHVAGPSAPKLDRDAARALLSESGQGSPLEVSLAHRSDPGTEAVAKLLKEMLDEVGFRVVLRPMPWSELILASREGRLAFFLTGWVFDSADAGGFLRDCVRSRREGGATGVFNPGYVNPEVDRLVDASHSVFISTSRLALLEEAIRIVTSEAPLVPLYHQPDSWAVAEKLAWRPRVDGRLIASEMSFAGGVP